MLCLRSAIWLFNKDNTTLVGYYHSVKNKTFNYKVNVIMDTTCFWRNWGVMVFKDNLTGLILLKLCVLCEILCVPCGEKKINRKEHKDYTKFTIFH
jgi:hypothetical protein